MDTLFIRGHKVDTIIGIYGWERELIRPLIFDVELGSDFSAAASSDAMRDSIDYAAVMETLSEVALALKPQLLETLAEQLARTLFERFPPVLRVKLTIHKPGAIPVQDVGVSVERRREDYARC
jgi:dihydroneopterin aldolase